MCSELFISKKMSLHVTSSSRSGHVTLIKHISIHSLPLLTVAVFEFQAVCWRVRGLSLNSRSKNLRWNFDVNIGDKV